MRVSVSAEWELSARSHLSRRRDATSRKNPPLSRILFSSFPRDSERKRKLGLRKCNATRDASFNSDITFK